MHSKVAICASLNFSLTIKKASNKKRTTPFGAQAQVNVYFILIQVYHTFLLVYRWLITLVLIVTAVTLIMSLGLPLHTLPIYVIATWSLINAEAVYFTRNKNLCLL